MNGPAAQSAISPPNTCSVHTWVRMLVDLGLYDEVRQALVELGYNLDELLEKEEEPGLGNGGLGRLAACYLDSIRNQVERAS